MNCNICDFETVREDYCPHCGYSFDGKNNHSWREWAEGRKLLRY